MRTYLKVKVLRKSAGFIDKPHNYTILARIAKLTSCCQILTTYYLEPIYLRSYRHDNHTLTNKTIAAIYVSWETAISPHLSVLELGPLSGRGLHRLYSSLLF